jgi:hypothetical protein
MEKKPFCTSHELKTDISQLCENCPLTDEIRNGISTRILPQIKERLSILSAVDFNRYLDREIDAAENGMQKALHAESQYKNYKNDPHRRNRIEVYIWSKERIKVLSGFRNELKALSNQTHKNKSGREAIVEKRIATSYNWLNNPKTEIPKLFNLMKDRHKLIDPETTLDQFTAVFTGVAAGNTSPIKWLSSNRLLAYFLAHTFESQDWQSIAGTQKLFLNKRNKQLTANDLSVAKNEYESNGSPKGHEKIDSILKEIKNIKNIKNS